MEDTQLAASSSTVVCVGWKNAPPPPYTTEVGYRPYRSQAQAPVTRVVMHITGQSQRGTCPAERLGVFSGKAAQTERGKTFRLALIFPGNFPNTVVGAGVATINFAGGRQTL